MEYTNTRQRTSWRDEINAFAGTGLSALTSDRGPGVRDEIRSFAGAGWSTLTPGRGPGEEMASN